MKTLWVAQTAANDDTLGCYFSDLSEQILQSGFSAFVFHVSGKRLMSVCAFSLLEGSSTRQMMAARVASRLATRLKSEKKLGLHLTVL